MPNNELGKRIPLEGTINTRDLGGYITKDGRKVKYRRLIRTDFLGRITDNDIQYILKELHPVYEVDMRSSGEIDASPNREIPGVTFVHLPIQESHKTERLVDQESPHVSIKDAGIKSTVDYLYRMDVNGDMTYAFEKVYRNMVLPYGQKHYEDFLRLCQKNKEGSILFHCADGKDRSGLAAALLLLMLGVDKETVIEDYLKSNENTKGKAQRREKYLREEAHIEDETIINSIKMVAGVRRNWIESAFDEMTKIAGSVDNFIKNNLHFTDEDIKELQDNYLE